MEPNDEENVFSFDMDSSRFEVLAYIAQQVIKRQFDYDRYTKSHTSRALRLRSQKMATLLELSLVRETQVVEERRGDE